MNVVELSVLAVTSSSKEETPAVKLIPLLATVATRVVGI